jgi:L-fuconolactonase
MSQQCGLGKGLDAKAEVVDVARAAAGRRSARESRLSVNVDRVDHRVAGTQLGERRVGAPSLHGAAEDRLVAKFGLRLERRIGVRLESTSGASDDPLSATAKKSSLTVLSGTRQANRLMIDAHLHVWTLARGDYGWPTPTLAPIYHDYAVADMASLAAQAGIAATVLVQAAPTVAETRFLLDAARSSGGFARGVVSRVDLASPDAIATLRELARPAAHVDPPHVAGPARSGLDPAYRRAARARSAAGAEPALRRAGKASATARARRDARPPSRSRRRRRPWRQAGDRRAPQRAVADADPRVAAHPRIHCKLSGLATESAADWTIDDIRPYADHLLDCFGPDRLMWGSDWPVVELVGGYARWRRASLALLADLGEREHRAVPGDTAGRFCALEAMR